MDLNDSSFVMVIVKKNLKGLKGREGSIDRAHAL